MVRRIERMEPPTLGTGRRAAARKERRVPEGPRSTGHGAPGASTLVAGITGAWDTWRTREKNNTELNLYWSENTYWLHSNSQKFKKPFVENFDMEMRHNTEFYAQQLLTLLPHRYRSLVQSWTQGTLCVEFHIRVSYLRLIRFPKTCQWVCTDYSKLPLGMNKCMD